MVKLSKRRSMGIFNLHRQKTKNSTEKNTQNTRTAGFEYLKNNQIYFDGACQSLRPQPVIDSLVEYYQKYNSCGERVKYQWGKITDEKVGETREQV